MANEAAIVAVRENREVLTADDFSAARDRILLGRREGSNVLLPEEKNAVAIHESGHALVAALSEHADPVAKITILPAGQTLGVTEQLPLDERHLYGEDYLTDSLAVRHGSRAAELGRVLAGLHRSSGDRSDPRRGPRHRLAQRTLRQPFGIQLHNGCRGCATAARSESTRWLYVAWCGLGAAAAGRQQRLGQ